jgi:hypothetical protein
MQFIIYVGVLVVAVFGVTLEWNTLVSPSTKTWKEIQTMSNLKSQSAPAVATKEPLVPAAMQTDTPQVVKPANPETAATTARPPAPQQVPPPKTPDVTPLPADNAQIEAAADAQTAEQKIAEARHCDINACAATYSSFRTSDCSYQPYDGPRRPCGKGASQVASSDARAEVSVGLVRCHVRACAETYSSFDPRDCTYQPFDGPRRVCEK